MAKYVIEIPDNTHWIQWIMEGTKDHHPYMDWKLVEDLTPYTEPDEDEIRQRVEREVWEFATMLMRMHPDVAESIYWSMNGGKGIGVAAEMTYQEAKEEYETWIAKRDELSQIRVGDEVVDDQGIKCVVTFAGATYLRGFRADNGGACYRKMSSVTKTNRHFLEVAELLKKMMES